MAYAIETHLLCKRYRRFRAVTDLNLQVPFGEVFGLLGPNGAGKTTTIMMLLGNVRASSGEAKLLGQPAGLAAIRKRVGFLPEKFQFHEFLTATEFLQLHGKLSGMSKSDLKLRAPMVLERVGLGDRSDTKIREFSKGMQQRLGVAQAIVHDPDLVILDEPTSALDPLGRRDIREIILELRAAGKTVVLNSHLLTEIETTCDRVAIIKQGQVAVMGTMGELLSFSKMVDIEVADLNDAALQELRKVTAKLRIDRVPITKLTAWVNEDSDIPLIAAAIVKNGASLISMNPQRETLEQVFMRIVESDTNSGSS